jgi:hypothetical protein
MYNLLNVFLEKKDGCETNPDWIVPPLLLGLAARTGKLIHVGLFPDGLGDKRWT